MKKSYEVLVEEEAVAAGAGHGHDDSADSETGLRRSRSSSSGHSTDESGGDSGSSNDDRLRVVPKVLRRESADGDSAPPTGDREDHSFGTGVSNEEVQRTANDILLAIWYPDEHQDIRLAIKQLPPKTLNVVAQRAFANNFTIFHEAAKYADLEMAELLLHHGATQFVDTYTSKYEVDRLAKIEGLRVLLNIQQGAQPNQVDIGALRLRYEHDTQQSPQQLSDDEVINHYLRQFENLVNQGELPNQSPLTNAVTADFVYGPGMDEANFPLEQENFELIRHLVHHSKSPVDALCAAIDCKDIDMLRFLLNMPKEYKDDDGIVKKINDSTFMLNSPKVINAVNDISRQRQVTPLMLASAARDVAIFQLLLQNQANPRTTGPNGNTVLHEAVLHINSNVEGEIDAVDVDFIDYLLRNDQFALCNLTNNDGQTALAIACAQKEVNLIGHLLRHHADIRIGGHLSPLHMAARYGNSQIVEVLLQERPAHTAEILSVMGTQDQPDPFQIALEEERKQILLVGERPNWDDYDAEAQHDWVGVQRSLLKFAHLQYAVTPQAKDNIFNSQFRNATEAIDLIADENLRQQFHDQLQRYRNDYQHNIQGQGEKFDQAIDKNIRILGLTNDLRKLADAFSTRGDQLSKDEKAKAVEDFKKCGRPKLYDDNIKTFWGALIGAVVGVIAGIIVGGVVGVFATGGPGAVIAIPTAADFGAIGGAAAGVALVGGATGAFTGTRVRDTLKYGFGLFKLNIALNKDLNNMPEPMAEADLAAPLVPPAH